MIPHPTFLENELVKLEPLKSDHFPGLIAAASDPVLWEYLPIQGYDPAIMERELKLAISNRYGGTQYPFTIIEKKGNTIIGSTRFFDIFPQHKKLEIGWTFYRPEVWGKGYNAACKYLLLEFCFEKLGLKRVQLKTRTVNLRSRAAIESIGATLEGTLRKDRMLPSGESRDTAMYSIIDEEWPTVKLLLASKLKANKLSKP